MEVFRCSRSLEQYRSRLVEAAERKIHAGHVPTERGRACGRPAIPE
jgi:hypothetical protein